MRTFNKFHHNHKPHGLHLTQRKGSRRMLLLRTPKSSSDRGSEKIKEAQPYERPHLGKTPLASRPLIPIVDPQASALCFLFLALTLLGKCEVMAIHEIARAFVSASASLWEEAQDSCLIFHIMNVQHNDLSLRTQALFRECLWWQGNIGCPLFACAGGC